MDWSGVVRFVAGRAAIEIQQYEFSGKESAPAARLTLN